MPLTVLIVDDEAFARQRLRRLLAGEPDVQVVGECASGREAVAAIAERRPDLVLLDVQMPELDGFGVLRALGPDRAPMVVFVTAFDEHALRAFDVHALDYLLKPVEPERLQVAVARARTQHGQATAADRHARLLALLGAEGGEGRGAPPEMNIPQPAPSTVIASLRASSAAPAPPGTPARLLVKEEGRMFFVRPAEIDWVEAFGNYAKLHVGTRTHLLRETMAHLEQTLEPAGFARIHRSAIVNLDRVAEMQPWFSGDYIVLLTDGTRLRLSRWYRERIEERMRR